MINYQPKTCFYVRNIPMDLRNEFKSICASNGTNMSEQIKILIKNWIEKKKEDKIIADKIVEDHKNGNI